MPWRDDRRRRAARDADAAEREHRLPKLEAVEVAGSMPRETLQERAIGLGLAENIGMRETVLEPSGNRPAVAVRKGAPHAANSGFAIGRDAPTHDRRFHGTREGFCEIVGGIRPRYERTGILPVRRLQRCDIG